MATSTSTGGNGSHAKEAIDREFENLKADVSKLTQQVATSYLRPAAQPITAPAETSMG